MKPASWWQRLVAGTKRAHRYGLAAGDFEAHLAERRELAELDAARRARMAEVTSKLESAAHALASMFPPPTDPDEPPPTAPPAALPPTDAFDP